MKRRTHAHRARWRRNLALTVPTALMVSLLQGVAPPAVAKGGHALPGAPDPGKPVAGKVAWSKPRKTDPAPRVPSEKPRTAWPKGGKTVVDLSKLPKGAGRALKADGLPVSFLPASRDKSAKGVAAAPAVSKAEVRIADRKASDRAGIPGPLIVLQAQATKADLKAKVFAPSGVRLDYSGFAQAYGGGYASRLRLMELPECVLTTPDKVGCRTAKPVAAVNDTEKRTLTADRVSLRASARTVLAAAPAAGGEKGDYKATPLSPSATWMTDLNSGSFTWSYDIPVPEVPGGLKPDLGLGYTSSAIDGRTGNTNNQSSWVGDGFELWPGFIERRYKPCSEDGEEHGDGNKPGDLCWAYDNATISFNGKAGELVPAGGDQWKLKKDDGTRVARLTGSEHDNGDNDNEYWRVTTPEGTRYYFGYHKLNAWAKGKDTTDSTWTVPVYGNNAGEPCHKDGFKESWCQQAWRWNLDYAVDRHGNAVGYYYGKETNSYGRDLESKDDTPYVRGGYLKRIEYGLQSSDLYAKPLAKVEFGNAERCLPQDQDKVTCAEDTIDDKKQYWYDTPWDMNCKAGTECDKGRLSPSFWTRKRLTDITTSVLRADGGYAPVDSWKLGHRWGMADTDYQLLLESIQHTGHSASPAITLPKTTLVYTQRPNRLDKTGDGKAPFIKERLSTVTDETGGQTDVTYSQPVCDWAKLPTPESNTTRCFPQFIGGSSSDDPTQQWFNKYVVDAVTATDRTGGAPDQVTRYDYLDDAAWHYDDDNGLTKEKFKTWSQWRGYGHVRVRTGGQGADGMKSQQDTYFLRGMDGDRKGADGGKKEVSVALGKDEGDAITDHSSAAGFTYKTESYSGPGGKLLAKTVSRPWHHETAKSERSWGTVTANFTGTESARSFTSLDDGAGKKWRQKSAATKYDTVAGRPTEADDFGDLSTPDDDQCTRTTYNDNADANILVLRSRVVTTAASCATSSVDRAKQVVSDVRTAYDGGGYGDRPTKGDATGVATLKKDDNNRATYLESGKTYDAYARELTSTDLTAEVVFDDSGRLVTTTKRTDGRTTRTAYTPSTGFATTVTTTAPPVKAGDPSTAWTSTTMFDPLRGQVLRKTDANNRRTDIAYDALGRSVKVWLPNKPQSSFGPPSLEFSYSITDGKPVAVATRKLNDSYGQLTAYTLYDGFQRPRQTQEPGPDGGKLITDTFYDERGLAAKTFAPYYALGAPGTGLFSPDNALKVESQTWNTYDGLGRVTETKQIAGNGDAGKVLATTRTLYGGDRTTVIPPVGSTATTAVVDARGRTTELHQLHERSSGADSDVIRYAYSPQGKLSRYTDPAGNSWSYVYDQLGHQVSAADPDKGTSTSTYDDRGQLTSVTDARKTKNTLYYAYDNIGRKTELHEGTAGGTKLAEWSYDTVAGGKGQLASATRYVDGNAYVSRVDEYDTLYRVTRSALLVPANEGALAGTYRFGTNYNLSGSIKSTFLPKAGSLAGDSVIYDYDNLLRPTEIRGSGGLKAAVTSYSLTGKPLQAKLTGGGKFTQITNGYEWGTQRLADTRVDRENAPVVDKAATYRYDEAGNIRSVSDAAAGGTDTQCFTYDYLHRVTDEWTQPTPTCAAAPAANLTGGPAPYWNSYTYDQTGNRLTETRHDAGGDSAKDVKRTYAYPAAGGPQPHALSAVNTSGPTGTAKDSYTYDPVGNTATRVMGGDTQALEWDAEGHLAKATQMKDDKPAGTTSYLYDAEGQRLIGRTDTETTLYLGPTEITLTKGATTPKATRYIDLGNGVQAVQSDDGSASFVIADQAGTGQLAIDSKSATATHRRTTPFGAPRGEQPKSWPGTKGFVGGTNDATTGLTHLGAREYDPSTGRFISVDPLLDLQDPQQNHGYTYANNNPATLSDPSGLIPEGCGTLGKCYGYSPSSGGCPYGCGSTANVLWGEAEYDDYDYDDYEGPVYNYWEDAASRGNEVIYAGIEVPAHWEEKEQFEKAFYREVASFCHGESINCLSDVIYSGYESQARSALNRLKFFAYIACRDVDCPDSVSTPMEAFAAAAAMQLENGMGGGYPGLRGARSGGGRSGGRGGSGPCHSFTTGTEVLLEDGSSEPIEDVETGDKVLATDPETGETTAREVVATFDTEHDKNFTDLTVKTADGAASIIATNTHPFWETTEKTWIDAGNLRPGAHLRNPNGETLQVTSTRHFVKQQRTHDLTVSSTHTYYVLAGKTPVLVHNSNGKCGPGISTRNEKAGDIGKYTDGQKTRDPASQWYHEELSNEELLDGINNPGAGDGILVSRDGTILGGHHRKDELQRRMRDGRIDPDTRIRIEVYDGE
ncbi:polymorphic toxin-type HINT domain-containing protein [Streptomyces sp. C36]|uniref:polymorphic toxin-type HINT domain-containing protein n=1 Tax=Streptomyces sp. C36 TaxID=3237122 RepID=UPI0034C6D3BD